MDTNPKPIKSLTLLNWNANGIIAKRSAFIHFLNTHDVDIACVTETHLPQSKNFKIPGYICHRKDRPSRTAAGGVAIFIKKPISNNFYPTPPDNSLELIATQITPLNGPNITVIAAYRPPNKPSDYTTLSALFNTTSPTILLGDLNAKNTSWGCNTSSPSGRSLLQIISHHNIKIHAPSDPTHYPSNSEFQPDILDIALSKNLNLTLYSNPLPELSSDHNPVLITTSPLNLTTHNSPSINLTNINWNHFYSLIDSNLDLPKNLNNPNDIDTAVEDFTKILILATNISISPPQNPNKCSSTKNSIPTHITKLINYKNKVRRIWQRNREPHIKTILNKLVRTIKVNLDDHRITRYQTFLASLSPSDKTLWTTTKKLLQEEIIIPPLTTVTGPPSICNQEKAETLATHFAKCFTPNTHLNPNQTTLDISTDYQPTILNTIQQTHYKINYISPAEIKQLIKDIPTRKSVGHDRISPAILKHPH